jgi:cytochrome c peroxidase
MRITSATTACLLTLSLMATSACADTPSSLLAEYTAAAAKTIPGFTPSAQRGQDFFNKERNVTPRMTACASCHGKDLTANGKHVVTGKTIDPLAPSANPKRFTHSAKVEKWFKRNCTEVVGRECTDAEKADFIQFVLLAK